LGFRRLTSIYEHMFVWHGRIGRRPSNNRTMSPIPAYLPPRHRTRIRRDLQKAALGRVYAEKIRGASVEAQRDQAKAARDAGLSVPEIAQVSHCSVPRTYQLLQKDETK
jgi:hypothetical protein